MHYNQISVFTSANHMRNPRILLILQEYTHYSLNTHNCLDISLDFVAKFDKLADITVDNLIKSDHTRLYSL